MFSKKSKKSWQNLPDFLWFYSNVKRQIADVSQTYCSLLVKHDLCKACFISFTKFYLTALPYFNFLGKIFHLRIILLISFIYVLGKWHFQMPWINSTFEKPVWIWLHFNPQMCWKRRTVHRIGQFCSTKYWWGHSKGNFFMLAKKSNLK